MLLRSVAFSVAVLVLASAQAAETPPEGYLKGAAIAFQLPVPPAEGSELARMDTAQVRAQHPMPQSLAWEEAIADARGYRVPDIIVRFNDVTERDLRLDQRPQLLKLLTRMRTDTEKLSNDNKALFARNRPYAQHPEITPCSIDFLVKDRSYPSGHALTGYSTAIVLADLFPEHADAILMRGVRYGENRVVCGVHYPSDILQGRILAAAYVTAVRQNPAFAADLACASHEDAVLAKKEPSLPAACTK